MRQLVREILYEMPSRVSIVMRGSASLELSYV
jgi:hypothetical protein